MPPKDNTEVVLTDAAILQRLLRAGHRSLQRLVAEGGSPPSPSRRGATIPPMTDTRFDTEYEQTLRPQLMALQQRGRRWLRGFWGLVFGGWALAIWVLFAEPVSPWWLLLLVLAVGVVGMVVMGEINGLKGTFDREVLGRLYAVEFPQARHDPQGEVDAEALQRAGLFPALFGGQRRELRDRLDDVHQGRPLALCAADITLPGDNEDNKPPEILFVGTLFTWQAPLPLSEPVVLMCGETPLQPMPPALDLGRLQQVLPGHPALDPVLRVVCNTPSVARAALTQPVVRVLADFVSSHGGPWRAVLDANGIVGGVDGPLLTNRIHPKAPLPDAGAVRAEVQRVRTVMALVAALTEGRTTA